MTVWWQLITILKQYRALRTAGLLTLCVGIITTLFLGSSALAAQGVNQTLSFQGRLLSASGAVVPDGYYNMQFKIYQDGTGTTAGDTGGTLKWTESYVNNNANGGIQVKDGFFSVPLGSENPFGTSVDWNQDTLFLSMNVGGSSATCTTFNSGSCTADGEMVPMKRITSAPYALNSGQLGGLTSDKFIQMAQGVQSDAGTSSSIFINKTASGNLLQLQNSATDIFTVGNAGDLTFGNNADKTISISTATVGNAGNNLTVVAGGGGTGTGSTGGNLVLLGGAAGGTNASGGGVQIDSGASVGTGTGGVISLGATNASAITLGNNSTVTQITLSGPTSVKQVTDSTTAFSVSSAASSKILTVDTTNGRVGVGGGGSISYALDVNGDTNTSGAYRIGGTDTLSSSALAFSGGTSANITTATGQSLTINGSDGVIIGVAGQTSISASTVGVQIGTGTGAGAATLFTLDKASSAPGSAALGSMYYDSTVGKVQCYQAGGWGACGNSPDTFVSLSPEYSNAVMNAAGAGTITSDFCSDSLNINDGSSGQPTVCGTNETYNFYGWNSTEVTAQTRSIYITYQLPSTFKNFVAGSTSLMGRTSSSDGTVSYQLYKSHGGSALSACSTALTASTGSQSSWQQKMASSTDDPTNCGFAAGDSMIVRIDLTSSNNSHAYVSNLNFAYGNQ